MIVEKRIHVTYHLAEVDSCHMDQFVLLRNIISGTYNNLLSTFLPLFGLSFVIS